MPIRSATGSTRSVVKALRRSRLSRPVVPPALNPEALAGLRVAVQASPAEVGVDLANWNWKGVRRFIEQRGGLRLSRSTCLRYLHRLGFVFKRPKKRLLKADAAQRAAFLEQYAALVSEAVATGAKIFFVDEAHFRADADLRGKWVLKGQPALVDSTSPRWGEKASYYSAVCLETAEVEYMELTGNSTAETSAVFLRQLRAKHPGPLIVIWDNGPAHGGEALRTYLATPALDLRLIRLPAYSPDFNADEAIWGWAREEVTSNTCLGTKALVQEKMAEFFAGLTARTAEVQTRCRTKLQALADALPAPHLDTVQVIPHGDSICALV
jgi:transposase